MADSMSEMSASLPASIPTTTLAAKGVGARFGVFLLIAFLFALLVSWSSDHRSYDERLIQISLKHLVAPEVYSLVGDSPELQALFLDYAGNQELTSKSRLAIEKYGKPAREVLSRYGDEGEFQDTLRLYGENIVPVIYYFVQNDLKSIRVQHLAQEKIIFLRQILDRLWNLLLRRDGSVAGVPSQAESYSPESRGRHAIHKVFLDGHQFLGQFEIDKQGHAHWIQTERVLEGVTSLFFSGVQNVERKVTLDEQLKMADLVWAGVDVVGIVSAAKVFKSLKGTAAVTRTIQELGLVERTKLLAFPLLNRSVIGRQVLVFGAKAGTAYLVIRHPGLLTSVFAELAKMLGISPLLGKILGWTLVGYVLLYPLVWIGRVLLFAAVPILKAAVHGLQWLQLHLFRSRLSQTHY
jgi:hypothetical protein